MIQRKNKRVIAILQALLVTFLWSTSFIIIKIGLFEIPPITFAGLRYIIAFLCFIPFIFRKKYLLEIKCLTKTQWIKLLLLGIVFYFLTQGIQFIGLSLLPSATVSLILNFTPLLVAFLGILIIKEKLTLINWIGSIIFIIGIITYFLPFTFRSNQFVGIIVMIGGVIANAISAVLGRNINKTRTISPLVVTSISMGIGAILLVCTGFLLNGLPEISIKTLLLLLWMAIINTAFAFTLWNISLQTLTAIESSIINGTMLIQIAVLAWIFLDENLTIEKIIGMIIAAIGAVLVQIKRERK